MIDHIHLDDLTLEFSVISLGGLCLPVRAELGGAITHRWPVPSPRGERSELVVDPERGLTNLGFRV